MNILTDSRDEILRCDLVLEIIVEPGLLNIRADPSFSCPSKGNAAYATQHRRLPKGFSFKLLSALLFAAVIKYKKAG